MDEYEKKFTEMQKYIPFLDAMIERLQKVPDNSREVQLNKMQQLRAVLSNSKRKMKIEVLQRCEDVLQKLHSKVGKGPSAGLNCSAKDAEEHPTGPSNASASANDKTSQRRSESRKVKSSKRMDETPASPSPPASPDVTNKSIIVSPITIPTERTHDYNDKVDSKPASPDESETVATKDPIIIPTERRDEWSEHQPQNVSHQTASKANSYGSHKTTDSRSHQRHTPPTNSTLGSRRISLAEKNRPEVIRLDDDSDVIHIGNSKQNQLTSSESRKPQQNPTSLLASPPPALNAPPLSMEELAELLDENVDGGSNRTSTSHGEKDNRSRTAREKLLEEMRKSESEKKSGKHSMIDYPNMDVDSDRRWEEVDKHIVKSIPRKGLPSSVAAITSGSRSEPSKADAKSQSPFKLKKPTDNKNLSVSPSTKSSDRNSELRYTDNYERYPRHSREHQSDNQSIPMPDMNVIKSAFSRLSEGDIANLVQTNLQIQTENSLHSEDRNPLFHRRPASDQHQKRPGIPETEFRRENSEFYDQHQQIPVHLPSGGAAYPPNPQWTPNSNIRGQMHGPDMSLRQQYQHPNNVPLQNMWNMGSNPAPMDNHSQHHITNQFGPAPIRPIRSLISPQRDMNFAEDMPLSPPPPLIPSLMSSPTFPNNQYRGFPVDNRQFERSGDFSHGQSRQQWDHSQNRGNEQLPFERPGDYSHGLPRQTQWDQLPNRPNEGPFDRPNEFPQQTEYPVRPTQWEHESNYHEGPRVRGMNENSHGRTPNMEPPLWGRSSGMGPEGPNRTAERGWSSERFSNERNRPIEPAHTNFNRSRPSEWDRPVQNDVSNRYRDRDPRCRSESTNQSPNVPSASIPKRHPRLSQESPSQLSSPMTKPKETPAPTPTPKPKDTPSVNKRDPRQRSNNIKDSHKSRSSSKSSSHRSRSRSIDKSRDLSSKHNSAKSKKDSPDHKLSNEKANKDAETMQSPLESLYGVIDTTAKTGKGYGLQKFKIPKIRRSEPVIPRPPTPPKPSRYAAEEEDWTADPVLSPLPSNSDSTEKNQIQQDDKKMEVTSTTKEVQDVPIIVSSTEEQCTKNTDIISTSKNTRTQSDEIKKSDNVLDDPKTTVDTSTLIKSSENDVDTPQESQLKDCVTQELIESLIRKSLESGEGKKLFEQAKLLQKLGEALDPKKYKKIQKIINADSDSGSSDQEEIDPTKKKILSKKKRRIIESDSSDEECLADRLGITHTKKKYKMTKNKKVIPESKKSQEEQIEDEQKHINEEEEEHDNEDNMTISEIEKIPPKKQKRSKKTKSKKATDEPTEPKDVTVEQPTEPKEEVAKPPGRIAKKRRNSLEMLQEDIREMFICQGVITATGHRMCRLLKEGDGNLSSINAVEKTQTTSVYVSSSPERQNDRQSDEDEVISRSRMRSRQKSVKNTDIDESLKSRLRVRKGRKRATTISKGILSSDSEAESTSATHNDTTAAVDETSDSAKSSNTVNKVASPLSDVISDDFGPALRRSERVALKEPRVLIEKTDLSKIDSSKIMFDTSSDESFGIDVSELAAAVDISLHSERQSADDGSDSITGSLKKIPDKIMKPKKKNSNDMNDEKTDTSTIFDDDVNMTSDNSMSSSVVPNVNKKIPNSSSPGDVNKELIVNMLGNLSDDKAKTSIDINLNKESDIEVDEDKDTSTAEENKKPQTKIKKKRFKWQMGIVPKCKKKKGGNSSITESTVSPQTVISDKDTMNSEHSDDIQEVPTPVTTSVSVVSDLNVTKEEKPDVEKLNSLAELTKCDLSDVDNEKELNAIQIKSEKKAIDVYQCLNVNELIEYAWTGQERYKCLLCQFNGKNIVHHYKVNHSGQEIMISRLTLLDAERAIHEAKDETFIKLSKKVNTGTHRKFTCRFCVFTTEYTKKMAMETFYEHCTTHTGEYRFSCKNCGYQSISKVSMKPHFYKICRKNCENFSTTIAEDPIPCEEYIPGYLCSICNYIQLKECNIKTHVETMHKNVSDVEIIKINMSGYFDVKDIVDLNDSFDEVTDPQSDNTEKNQSNFDLEVLDVVEPAPEQKLDEADSSHSNKLNAFVCPPELENKEDEIQLERKKKMQEILNNIGIKLQKPSSNKGLSIIDKLKDKMTTNISDSTCVQMEINDNEDTTNVEDSSAIEPTELLADESSQATLNAEEEKKVQETETSIVEPAMISSNTAEEPQNSAVKSLEVNADRVEKKMKDPLASLQNEEHKDGDSEHEVSDGEPIVDVSRPYESDSSDEMSDTELRTDVNSLLEAAGTINTSTNAPMMTTIQRLAAQLQGVKNFSTNNDNVDDEKNGENEKMINKEILQDAVVDSSSVPMVDSNSNKSSNQPSTSVITPSQDSQLDDGRKNFIRLRRLSGDKLSIQEPTSPSQSQISKPALNMEEKSSELSSKELLKADDDEECSFLKIENVVSLAPNAANENNASPIINDIRKAVGTSPAKTYSLSLLKKPVGVLKNLRPVSNLEGLIGRLPPIAPVPPKCITISKIPLLPASKNVKIVKVVRELASLNQKELGKPTRETPPSKQKESPQISSVPKLKTIDAYTNMLTAAKLRHLYKCMARSCVFTSDSADAFGRHFQSHLETSDPVNTTSPCDYQKCAYCSDSLLTWDEMRSHFKTKHTFCSFQCSYCFYRAFTQSYVELHQSTSHPGKPPSVILGMRDYHPPEMIDRREYVIPFVCKHECNKLFYVPEAFIAHLRKKHGATLSIFKCHLCSSTTLKSEQLIAHYKLHGIYKYQCLYCLFGADALMELHHHLSLMHFNRPPKILERSLPPQTIRDKDVLLQLIIRNLDDTFKCSELKIIADTPGLDNICKIPTKKRKRSGQAENPGDVLLSGNGNTVAVLPGSVKIVNHSNVINLLDSGEKTLSPQRNNMFVNLGEKLPADNSKDNQKATLPKINEGSSKMMEKSIDNDKYLKDKYDSPANISVEQLVHQEPELELRYANEQLKSKIDNAVDPLSLPDNLNCSDEFISINVLDNPEMLKGVDRSVDHQNDDDSDIEILEHIHHNDDKSRNVSVPKTLPVIEVQKSIVDKENNKEDKKNEMKQAEPNEKCTAVCSSPENSNTSGNNVRNSSEKLDIQDKPHGPLTLEDIKHTGFTGRDLYKCGFGCPYTSTIPSGVKNHVTECPLRSEKKELTCVHCAKRFVKIGYLLEHFKIHGLKRFGCSICSSRYAVGHQAVSHMKFKHKVNNSKLVPADPTNPSQDGLFVIHPHKGTLQKNRGKKSGKSKSSDKKRGNDEKTTFSPADIDALPRQAIYNREVQCAVCPYKTKVRTNIIRHLQLHAKDETVPESGPVNPVPCLDKKERMFDKMVNLASSSHQNGRMSGTTKETVTTSEADGLPKFVMEQKRYVCGVVDCNCLTVNETMLRYHLKALHPDEVNFRCPHCPSQSPGQETSQIIPIEKMGVHLKMHDTRLYKCSHCNHHHYHRHVVERHMMEKHAEHRPYVKIIREIENTENARQSPVQEEPEEGPADRDGNYWKCNLCDYKCVYKSEMVTHAGSTHNEKAQFKCSMCIFKTTARISLEQHIMSKHVDNPDCAYTLAYERIKGPKPATIAEASSDEPFDTTPLWRRDMPRIRHIRGILLEEENEVSRSSDTSSKSLKRKSDGEISTKPTKIKMVKSMSSDGSSALDNKGKSETKGERIDNPAGTTLPVSSSLSNQATVISELNVEGTESAPGDSCEKIFALKTNKLENYGEPNGNFYVCSLCPNYKSKFRQDMRDHLYKELKYWRWHCKTCGYLAVSQSYITKHVNRQHKNTKAEYVAIKPKPEIENWVQTFLSKQLTMMRNAAKNSTSPLSSLQPLKKSKAQIEIRPKPPTITLEDIVEIPMVQVPKNAINHLQTMSSSTITVTEKPSAVPVSTIAATETAKTVDLTAAISSLQAINKTQLGIDSDDNDDDDDDQLVIDSKDESFEDKNSDITLEEIISPQNESIEKEENETIHVCKHCDMKFARWRGFKLHVQVNHLKRLGFLCPYCDRSTNSETVMRQHIRTKHIGLPENIIHNPAAGGPELSDSFWEQEYGLIRPKKIKKRRPKRPNLDSTEAVDDAEKMGTTEICTICGFSALNFTGLKVHMRAHANKHTLKCVHCSFTTNSKSEVWQHSEINHPNMEWRAQEINSAGSSEGQPIHQYTKPLGEEDYSEDIEEEAIPESFEPKFIHGCFYCNLRSTSLDSVKKHWTMVHKDPRESSEYRTGVPFRYKEIPVKTISQHKLMKCAYCPKKGALSSLRTHCRKKHPNVQLKFTEAIDRSQDIWVCKWCNESCEANAKTAHHNMFHSHLPVRFKKEHDMQIMQKGYICPECGFVTISLSRMKTHVAKHYDTFRCKRCDSNFSSIILATQHSTREHPGLSANIEGIASNIDLIMARVSETDCTGILSSTSDDVKVTPTNDIFRNLGVAKKSTTKQILRTPTSSPSKLVARKSTNPLPRYPPGTVFDIDNIPSDCDYSSAKNVGRSYYGLPRKPIDLANLNTTMSVGGLRMNVKCNTLAQIIDIDPRVVLIDINRKG